MAQLDDSDYEEFDEAYPLVPLRDVVIFPSMATAILVGRQPSINAVERAIESDKILLVVTQKVPAVNEPEPQELYKVGTLVRIGLFFRLPDGTIKVMLEGLSRVRILEYLERDNYLAARIEPMDTIDRSTREVEALARRVESFLNH
jgi:ATP-dependent Lon protease